MNFLHSISSFVTGVAITLSSFLGFTPEPPVLEPTPVVVTAPQSFDIPVSYQDYSPSVAAEEEPALGATKPAGLFPFFLGGGGLSSAATSFTLTSFTLPQNDYPIQDSDLSDTFYLTLEPGSTQRQEFISCTTVGSNTGGSVSFSGCTRGLSPIYPYTASTSLQFAHSGGSIVILSDAPQLFERYGSLSDDEAVTGYWTAPDPLSAQGVATRQFVLDNVNGGAVSTDQIIVAGTAGETVAAGNLVYFDEPDDEWKKVDTDTAATYQRVPVGIAQGSGTNGNPVTGGVLVSGLATGLSGLTAGVDYYGSGTAGAFGTVANGIGLGRAKSTTELYFSPVLDLTKIDNTFTGTNTFTAGVTTFDPSITGHASTSFQVYTSGSNAWTKPSEFEYVSVWVCAGGGGGGGNTGGDDVSGGGGGGGCAFEILSAAELAATSSIQALVGVGGTAGAGTGGTGGTGGTSSFGNFLSAAGGTGGTTNADGGGGGIGSGGDLNFTGGGGDAGGNDGNMGGCSAGGSSHFGGGAAAKGATSNGGTGGVYGGGGGGACHTSADASDQAGGVGGAGVVIITTYF